MLGSALIPSPERCDAILSALVRRTPMPYRVIKATIGDADAAIDAIDRAMAAGRIEIVMVGCMTQYRGKRA